MADIAGSMRPADSWSNTEVRTVVHNHLWTIKNFSQCECRYLETTAKVKDNSSSAVCSFSPNEPGCPIDPQPITFRIRLHPQGNKESNKDFSFFQCYPNPQTSVPQPQFKAKYKFTVFNSRGDETATTVYTGTQQLHGYFEYIRRDLLLSHVQPQDELQLQLTISVTFDTVTRVSHAIVKPIGIPEPQTEEVTKALQEYYVDNKLTDFTIVVDGRELKAHKVLLACRSPVFAAMLEPHTEEAKNSRVVIEGVDCEVMDEMLRFIYSGQCPRLSQYGLELLAVADRFELPGLKSMAEQILRGNLSVDTACRNLVYADMYNASELKAESIRYIIYNIVNVLQTDSWMELAATNSALVTEVVAALASDRSRGSFVAQTCIAVGSPIGMVEPPSNKRVRYAGPGSNNNDGPVGL